jgi:hypothetical protein
MLPKLTPPYLLLFATTITSTFAMSTTRYTVPIPESLKIIETRQELNDMATEYSSGYLVDRNGGYYLVDGDESVVGITSDSLCEELDTLTAEALRYHALEALKGHQEI